MDVVDVDAAPGQILVQRIDQFGAVVDVLEGRVDQVDAQRTECDLLSLVRRVVHQHVQDDLAGCGARLVLEADAQPAVALVVHAVALGRNGVREGKVERTGIPLVGDALDDLIVLAFQHALQSCLRDVAARLVGTVDRVAEAHVVGRTGLGDRARRAAGLEEIARHLLARADLDDRTVEQRIQVEFQGLLERRGLGRARVQER